MSDFPRHAVISDSQACLKFLVKNIHNFSSYHRKTSELATCKFRCGHTSVRVGIGSSDHDEKM